MGKNKRGYKLAVVECSHNGSVEFYLKGHSRKIPLSADEVRPILYPATTIPSMPMFSETITLDEGYTVPEDANAVLVEAAPFRNKARTKGGITISFCQISDGGLEKRFNDD